MLRIILNLTEEGIAAFLEAHPLDKQTSENVEEHVKRWCRKRLFDACNKGVKRAASNSAVIDEEAVTIGQELIS